MVIMVIRAIRVTTRVIMVIMVIRANTVTAKVIMVCVRVIKVKVN
jgi:hypothetical protein